MLRGVLQEIGREMAAERRERESECKREFEKIRAGLGVKRGVSRFGDWCKRAKKRQAI
jgi:hypothetical protein